MPAIFPPIRPVVYPYLESVLPYFRLSSLSPLEERLSKMAGGIASNLEDVIHTFTRSLAEWERSYKRGRR